MAEGDKYSIEDLRRRTIGVLKEGGFHVTPKGEVLESSGGKIMIEARVAPSGKVNLCCSERDNETILVKYLDRKGFDYSGKCFQ